MDGIVFETELLTLRGRTLLRLPAAASERLPSRGQVAVAGHLRGAPFSTVLEPDGEFGHWMNVGDALMSAASVSAGDHVHVEVVPSADWPEPAVPDDLTAALASAPDEVRAKWADITSMARWEWVRWVNETKSPQTRFVRIEKTVAKLAGHHRRPCCFNLAACTDAELARSGRLAVPGARRP